MDTFIITTTVLLVFNTLIKIKWISKGKFPKVKKEGIASAIFVQSIFIVWAIILLVLN